MAASQSPISVFIQTPATTQAQASSTPRPPTVTSNCGICFETFQVVAAPREAANLSAFASNAGKGKAVAAVPDSNAASEYGVLLPCSNSHGFCIDCLTQYIKSKLHSGISLEGKGFPIGCPGCNAKNSGWEVDDDMAERVLDEETLEFWRRQKLLLSLPGVVCSNSLNHRFISNWVSHESARNSRSSAPTIDARSSSHLRKTWSLICQLLPNAPRALALFASNVAPCGTLVRLASVTTLGPTNPILVDLTCKENEVRPNARVNRSWKSPSHTSFPGVEGT